MSVSNVSLLYQILYSLNFLTIVLTVIIRINAVTFFRRPAAVAKLYWACSRPIR